MILAECIKIAEEKYDGHFTLMKFTGNWRFCFGTIEGEIREDIQKMASGKTMHEAVRKGIDEDVCTYNF